MSYWPADAGYKLADNDAVTAEVWKLRGITLPSVGRSADGDPARRRHNDRGRLAPAPIWPELDTGGICPQADVASGDDVVVIGVARSASVLA